MTTITIPPISPSLTLRENVSSPLTWAQIDGNLTNIVSAVNGVFLTDINAGFATVESQIGALSGAQGAGGCTNVLTNSLVQTTPGTITYDTASGNYLLPLASSVAAGVAFELTCQNSISSGLGVQGADTLILNVPNNATFNASSTNYPFRLHSGDLIGVISDGVSKWIVTGTPQMQFASSGASWSPPVGSVRRGAMNVTTASASATYTAAELVLGSKAPTSFNNFNMAGPSFKGAGLSLGVNLGTTGAGGMDIGSAPTSGFVGLYVIFNPAIAASGSSDVGYALLAVNATSTTLPDVYGGSAMPAGYAYSALVAVWPTNASGQFVAGTLIDREFYYASPTGGWSTTIASINAVSASIANGVPMNARSVGGNFAIGTSASGAELALQISATNFTTLPYQGVGAFSTTITGLVTTSIAYQGATTDIPLVTAQTVYYAAYTTSGTFAASFVPSRYAF